MFYALMNILKDFKNANVFISSREKSNSNFLSQYKNNINLVSAGDILYVDDEKFHVVESDNNVSLFGPESNVVFTGDALISRKGIDKILALPKNTIVMPSEGEDSSIRIECAKK